MKYKCPDCGKVYNYKPTYCECGNDNFKDLSVQSDKSNTKKQKENPVFLIIFMLILLVGIAFGLNKILNLRIENREGTQIYINKIVKTFFTDFEPQGITQSGYCIVYFSINEQGKVYNKKFFRKSNIFELDSKVSKITNEFSTFDVPPKSLTDKPIYIEFGCTANAKEVGCYCKKFKERTQ